MKLICESSVPSKSKKSEQLMPLLIDRIFMICREDNNFTIKDELKQIDSQLNEATSKIQKQNSLLKQASELKLNVQEKITALDDESFRIKVRVLERLGSDI